jgi:hypothetical protein
MEYTRAYENQTVKGRALWLNNRTNWLWFELHLNEKKNLCVYGWSVHINKLLNLIFPVIPNIIHTFLLMRNDNALHINHIILLFVDNKIYLGIMFIMDNSSPEEWFLCCSIEHWVCVLFTSEPVHNNGIRLAAGPFQISGPEGLI